MTTTHSILAPTAPFGGPSKAAFPTGATAAWQTAEVALQSLRVLGLSFPSSSEGRCLTKGKVPCQHEVPSQRTMRALSLELLLCLLFRKLFSSKQSVSQRAYSD